MVKSVKGAARKRSAETTRQVEKPKGHHGRVAASDEQARKISRHGVEFLKRFKSGIRYLDRKFAGEIDETRQEEGWKPAFRDVIEGILRESGLDYESIVDFTLKQYWRFLKEHPEEKERVKKQVVRMSQKLREKKHS